jgi:hypothetical protein
LSRLFQQPAKLDDCTFVHTWAHAFLGNTAAQKATVISTMLFIRLYPLTVLCLGPNYYMFPVLYLVK